MINLNPLYLSYLLDLVKKINSSLNLHDLLSTVNQELTQMMQVEASAILVFDSHDQELYFLQAGASLNPNITGIKVPINGSVAGWVIQKSQPVHLNDPNQVNFTEQFHHSSTRNLAAFPLIVNGKVIGVLEVINKAKGDFTAQDISFLTELSFYIAIALENSKLYENSRSQLKSTFAAFSSAIDKRDSYTHFHSKRVRDYAVIIASELGLNPFQLENLELAAILHDIGKIGIKDDILLKPGQLTKEEYTLIKEHPLKGAEILSLLEGICAEIITAVRYHHERWDGTGYPDRLTAENIPMFARILTICDVFDALTTDRPYRSRISAEAARDFIIENKGRIFDPALVDTFLTTYEALIKKGELT